MEKLIYEETYVETSPQENVCAARCPVTAVLDMLQGKWKNHVLFIIGKRDTIRFSRLKKELPQVTNTALTNTLRELELCGLVNRTQYNEIPPHVEYSLTEKGRDLMAVYDRIKQWSLKHLDTDDFRKYKDFRKTIK